VIKILIGACIRQDQTVLEWYWKSLIRLKLPPDTEVEYCFVDDSDGKIYWSLTPEEMAPLTVLESDPRPEGAKYNISAITHEWYPETLEHLLLQYAQDKHFNYFLLVDSDLLLDPDTLLSLISLDSPISSAVFWSQWEPNSPPLPQVWLRNPYEMQGLGIQVHEFLRSLAERQVVRVIGGGACTLFDTRVFSHCRYHPRLEGLPTHGMWQGEDRTMSITCQQSHIEQFADGWPDIFHAYHPKMRTDTSLKLSYEALQAPKQLFANYGDLVSFELEALDISIPAGAPHDMHVRLEQTRKNLLDPRVKLIRGRLGGLKIAPEIESALMEISPGQEIIIEIKFPFYHDHPEYQNKTKLYKLKLHGIKPFGYAPILNENLLGSLL